MSAYGSVKKKGVTYVELLALAGEKYARRTGRHAENDGSDGDRSRSVCDIIRAVELTLDYSAT